MVSCIPSSFAVRRGRFLQVSDKSSKRPEESKAWQGLRDRTRRRHYNKKHHNTKKYDNRS